METTPQSQPATWPPRRVAMATLVVLAIACAFWLVIQFRLVFFSLFIAIVLSMAIEPLVSRMARLGIPRAVSVIVISLVALAALAILVFTLAPLISEQWATLTNLVSSWYAGLIKALNQSSSLLVRRIAVQLPPALPIALPANPPAPPNATPTPGQGGVVQNMDQVLAFGSNLLYTIFLIFTVGLLTGFWAIEGERAKRFIVLAFQPQQRESVRSFLDDMEGKVGAYTRGLALLSSIIGVMATIAYMIIGLPNVLLLGIMAAIMELVPLVGPLLGAIPALLVAASISQTTIIWVIGASILIQSLENHLIVPRVMDKAVGVNPVVSLLAFLGFGSIFGFVGALLAVPLAAVIQLIFNRVLFEVNPVEQAPPAGRDAISSLRYEAQNLAQDVRKQVRVKDVDMDESTDEIEESMEAIIQDLDSILAQMEVSNHQNGARKERSQV